MVYGLILLLVVVTLILGKISIKLGMSEVVGQLLSGIILGAGLLNIVHPTNLIHLISEVGIFILMLNSGMESDIKEMRKHIKASTIIAILGVVLPMVAFPIVFALSGYSLISSLFAGVVFSATSISITLSVLAEQKKLGTPMGAIILSAAVLDDIIALVAVTLFSIFIGGGTLGITSILPLIAFILGILLRKIPASDILSKVSSQLGRWFFYPVFFGAIGLEVSIQGLGNKVIPIILFSVLAVITKFAGSFIGARLSGLNYRVANAIAAGMVSRGEMALIITQIGIAANIINEDISGEFIIAIIISTIVAPIMMKPLFSRT
ncbi:cation:proton antiporter [Leuconostoc fallax]|uniref:Cation/H+ exchanger transmembrane domain-containing protein n=1 Tax=Leuconostoc fallax TaxID=1251 RepID=A0A4R5N794_9LACO|nr:cation:proton antiporter [Leuconostoc fallax]MBU7455219.1 cation:proton antiporter [Leuconostoc fallax]TDG67678.1 hypothetical protein C5L23_001477 [Leuconostoc fallax]